MKKGIILAGLLVIGGCMSKPKTEEGILTHEEAAQGQFEKGLKFMDSERYPEAVKVFEKILVQSPASEFDFVVMYNLGAAYEGLKNCKAAAERYQQVTKGSAGKFTRLEALALLRLSYAYECLGQNDKVIVALVDVRRRAKNLGEDTAKSELPARLAAAYARSGNRKEAEKYFKEALKGIQFLQVKYKDSVVLADRLAETLYFMGRSHVAEAEFLRDPVTQVKGLELMQLYLLQAAELGSGKWSGRAAGEILGTYGKVWKFMDQIQAAGEDDATLRRRRTEQLRSDVLKETLHSVRVLRAQRLPSRQETATVSQLFQGLEQEERKLTAMLSELGPHSELTPEANRREGLRRQGRVESPVKTRLETSQEKRSTTKAKGAP